MAWHDSRVEPGRLGVYCHSERRRSRARGRSRAPARSPAHGVRATLTASDASLAQCQGRIRLYPERLLTGSAGLGWEMMPTMLPQGLEAGASLGLRRG